MVSSHGNSFRAIIDLVVLIMYILYVQAVQNVNEIIGPALVGKVCLTMRFYYSTAAISYWITSDCHIVLIRENYVFNCNSFEAPSVHLHFCN